MPMTKQAAALGRQIHAALANKGQTIGERVLVSDNVGELQRVPGLLLENWGTAA
jgi:predicted nucleic acid-binding protein